MHYYYPPMYGYDWGWGVLMMVVWIALIVGIGVVVYRLIKDHGVGNQKRADPMDIAKERYARGEITKEQFEQLKQDLK